MPMAVVNRRMNSWFSAGIRAFDNAARSESDGWSDVVIVDSE